MKAIWNNEIIAESDDTIVVEGNHYFPRASLRDEFFRPSDHTSVCSWKGTASYFDVVVSDKENAQAAWYYPDPKSAAGEIKDHVAFWRGVEVS